MDAFESQLKAAFAESADPVDDGFTVAVGRKVAGRESQAKWALHRFQRHHCGRRLGRGLQRPSAAERLRAAILASFGLEIARAHGALNQGESLEALGQSALQGRHGHWPDPNPVVGDRRRRWFGRHPQRPRLGGCRRLSFWGWRWRSAPAG